ncbi:cardiolipin synthase ClsB [Uliginosibacterium sp. sgz301328]|uniref:cardiolipin synthase ClsB n=1 Tax=Uliginosibacterium sp. sgz301328 TaxID=3243764 RepID=UPI00359D222E
MAAPLLPGNALRLLESGGEFFPALCAALNAARYEIHLESYIYNRDDSGILVTNALLAAAARGVSVRVIVDAFGGRDFAHDTMPVLLNGGVEVLLYNREFGITAGRQRLRRLHRKLAVIDRQNAFIGGINIIDDMHTPNQIPPRIDYSVLIRGPLAGMVWQAASELWERLCWTNFRRPPSLVHLPVSAPLPVGDQYAALVLRDNFRHRNDIEGAYLAALQRARREMIIANAYFLPGRRFRNALVDAARRGVTVTLLLQGRMEYWLLRHGCRALYPHLMQAGVRIVEYRKSFLHAKVAVMDDDWATVGSSNIDPFSLLVAREANVVVRDAAFAAQLRASLTRAMVDGGVELTPDEWRRRPLAERLAGWVALTLVRILVGMSGYARSARQREG